MPIPLNWPDVLAALVNGVPRASRPPSPIPRFLGRKAEQ
jgi:hypothetical protein